MTGNKNSRLLKLVEEKTSLKKQRSKRIPYFPKEIISNILLRLPPKSLQSSRFVCKAWYTLTSTRNFINTHLQETEPVIIFQTSVLNSSQENQRSFLVESNLLARKSPALNLFPKGEITSLRTFCLKFVAIRMESLYTGYLDVICSGEVRGACNGLILLDNKINSRELIVMNPLTKESCVFPCGTIFTPRVESYGLAYCKPSLEYKVVHLFQDTLGFVSCEIFNLSTQVWKAVDGPNMGIFKRLGFKPVSAIGALHWISHHYHSDYIVSMEIDEEKFQKTMLPKPIGLYDSILEMGGSLCFFNYREPFIIDVFVLKELNSRDWEMKFSIETGLQEILLPLFISHKEKEIIFKNVQGLIFAYDLQLRILKEVDMKEGFTPLPRSCFAHVNSIVSWKKVENDEDLW